METGPNPYCLLLWEFVDWAFLAQSVAGVNFFICLGLTNMEMKNETFLVMDWCILHQSTFRQ